MVLQKRRHKGIEKVEHQANGVFVHRPLWNRGMTGRIYFRMKSRRLVVTELKIDTDAGVWFALGGDTGMWYESNLVCFAHKESYLGAKWTSSRQSMSGRCRGRKILLLPGNRIQVTPSHLVRLARWMGIIPIKLSRLQWIRYGWESIDNLPFKFGIQFCI